MNAISDRRCRECGIDHIEPGVEIDGEMLCWADDDLCSACQDRIQTELVRDAERYRHLRKRETRQIAVVGVSIFSKKRPKDLILVGEDLDRAVDAELGKEPPVEPTLEVRLAECLADCIDKPLLTISDIEGPTDRVVEIRLGSFNRELSERAAGLLEEAGR